MLKALKFLRRSTVKSMVHHTLFFIENDMKSVLPRGKKIEIDGIGTKMIYTGEMKCNRRECSRKGSCPLMISILGNHNKNRIDSKEYAVLFTQNHQCIDCVFDTFGWNKKEIIDRYTLLQ
jgi:hypothetical protein